MSFSLSNLLNPTEESKGQAQEERKSSLPSISHLQSPEQQQQQHGHSPPTPAQPYVQDSANTLPSIGYGDRRQSMISNGSSHGIELPAPPLQTARKPSSPTLEQYAVASRSPETRRASMATPAQEGVTLPPLKGFGVNAQETSCEEPMPTSSEVEQPVKVGSEAAGANAPEVEAALSDPNMTSPPRVKQEAVPTPRATSPTDARRSSIHQGETPKAIATLKHEHSVTTQSPLRESSVPVPSTEHPTPAETAPSKKRPAPPRTKKGTATMTKKAPASKKRKVERSETPLSRTSHKAARTAANGTPANSSPAPSARSQSASPEDDDGTPPDSDEDVEGSGDVYCICRKPDNGTFMIGCDGSCDDWYHGKCVNVEERDKNLIDKFICPACEKLGAMGKTTYKRACRRSGCRQPARVSKAGGASKYCSDECGTLFFKTMARGKEDPHKRSSRRKPSLTSQTSDMDLGARGGVLAAGEVKSLLDSSATASDFKSLGSGVLSPPATPDGKDGAPGPEFTDTEVAALARIADQKETSRTRHQLLKDRMKFIAFTKEAASRAATERGLKPKEYCGYDPRLEWSEAQFASYLSSPAGKRAFELETLAIEPGTGEEKVEGAEEEVYAQAQVCDRKKCARHLEWSKLAVDDVRCEMSENSDRMRGLEREEREIRERATLKQRLAGLGAEARGTVEVHGSGMEEAAEERKEGKGNVVMGAGEPAADTEAEKAVEQPVGMTVEDPTPMAVESAA